MGLWILERDDERVRLTYTHEPLSANPLVQPCGAIDLDGETALEAWVFDEASVWDLIRTRRGTFVRQRFVREVSLGADASAPTPWADSVGACA